MEKPRILLISSANPLVGAGRVALDYYKAFLQDNYEIDFLTLYPVEGYPKIKYVYKKPSGLRNWVKHVLYRITGKGAVKPGYFFFYSKEQLPPVPVRKVLNKLDKRYDLILVLFWQELLSFKTIKLLFINFHCQIHFMGIDYSQMSGGCHFTGDCSRYQVGCGMCPAISSNKLKDFTYYNVRYRQKIYQMVNPIVYGNSYMRNNFYSNAFLLKNARVEQSCDIYDMDEFFPMDKKALRNEYSIPSLKRFIMFFGCQNLNDPRKGVSFLLESIYLFWKKLDRSERNEILIIVAGNQFSLISGKIPFDSIDLGFVEMKRMPELYSLADVYLSPSVNDAGPMMVNQALCCGTPVVAFEMGTALESVKDKGTGYCAKLMDSEDFARGIEYVYRMSDEAKCSLRTKCRDYAINTFSYAARVKTINEIYKKYNAPD